MELGALSIPRISKYSEPLDFTQSVMGDKPKGEYSSLVQLQREENYADQSKAKALVIKVYGYENEAFKEMAAIFGKHVTNLYKSSRESVTDTEAENVEAYTADITKALVDVKLVGVNIINHYEDKEGTLYSLAYLNLDAFGDNLEKMNDLDKKAAAQIRSRAESNFEDLNSELEKARGN